MDPDYFQKLWTFGIWQDLPFAKDIFQLKPLGRFLWPWSLSSHTQNKNFLRTTRWASSPTSLTQQVATFQVNDQSAKLPIAALAPVAKPHFLGPCWWWGGPVSSSIFTSTTWNLLAKVRALHYDHWLDLNIFNLNNACVRDLGHFDDPKQYWTAFDDPIQATLPSPSCPDENQPSRLFHHDGPDSKRRCHGNLQGNSFISQKVPGCAW